MLYTSHVLLALDGFFFVFHTALILFNVFGWIPKKTRKWNLLTLLLTAASWLVLGIWKGVGYCLCTDLHWRVRAAIGLKDHADSYIVLLVQKLTGWTPPPTLANTWAMWVFIFSLSASVYVNIRDFRLCSLTAT